MSAEMSRRRALIAGAVVTPVAFASSSIAAVQSPAEAYKAVAAPADDSDAGLLQLGRLFETAWSGLNEARSLFFELHEEVLASAKKSCPGLPECREDWTLAHEREFLEAQGRAEEASEELRRAEDTMNDGFERCDNLCSAISAITPTTIAGAGVRARAAMYASPRWWEKPHDEMEFDQLHSRLLIEALCAAAGLPTNSNDWVRS